MKYKKLQLTIAFLSITLCWKAIANEKKLPPNSKKFKACYVANLMEDNALWMQRTHTRIEYTKKQRYYRKSEASKRAYDMWFKAELDKLSQKKNWLLSLEKKYGQADSKSSTCKSFNGFYHLDEKFEQSL